ncbi:MAG: thioredoxin fold domain-containing protein [Flavobacteriales bacterium]|nr:thioredoxin fold domain-containing protein [Flavobacteriales bacterium]
MKKLLYSLLLLSIFSANTFAQGDQIQWRTIEEVEALQLKEARKVLMDVYTTWCGPCKLMMKNTFSNKNVIDYINKNYYAVKFDAESGRDVTFKGNVYSNPGYSPNAYRKSSHQLAQALNVSSYPTVIYMDENMEVIAPIKGYLKPNQIELYLKLFAENIYLDVKSKEDFQKFQADFKPTFHPVN